MGSEITGTAWSYIKETVTSVHGHGPGTKALKSGRGRNQMTEHSPIGPN